MRRTCWSLHALLRHASASDSEGCRLTPWYTSSPTAEVSAALLQEGIRQGADPPLQSTGAPTAAIKIANPLGGPQQRVQGHCVINLLVVCSTVHVLE